MTKYVCTVCGYVYDESAGIPDDGIAPGTLWSVLPEDWNCPLCGAVKADFNAAKLFKAASDAEMIHALKHFEVAGKVGSTADNLKDGIAGETHEYKEMYPDFVMKLKRPVTKPP